MSASALSMRDVSLRFGTLEVLRDFSLEVAAGEVVAIVGPSGCGKTSLLNLVSGAVHASAGSIARNGRSHTVHQSDGLFPWLTAAENIALGLRHVSAPAEPLAEMIALVGLGGFEHHYPHRLSGGMRQRVELARALVGNTELLLLDEPFSSLDYLTRLRLRGELARMLALRPRAVLLVTHDIEEAVQLGDRVLVLSERPARILRELRPSSPRPRDVTHVSVVENVHAILTDLGIEK
jgi:NitT/TauT family transport system ATP-binding protein